MTENEIYDILCEVFGSDFEFDIEFSDRDNLNAYIFQNVEMDELLELSKQIKSIDPLNTFKISYLPKFAGLAIIFFKWMK